MTTTIAYTPSPIIEYSPYLGIIATGPSPTLMWLGQASGIVVGVVRNPDIITTPITTYTLYRGPSATGPWTQVDVRLPSPLSLYTNLFDEAPLYGTRAYYYATIDGPLASDAQHFIAQLVPTRIGPGGALSAGAFGPYPLLGSDVFLNRVTGEAMIGPNGDMLAVNGLECLAQDLWTRVTTEQGELLLHPDFGLTRERLIGSGQADAASQAQMLQARFIDCLIADPRVLSITALTISMVSYDSWSIDVTLMAIGFEAPSYLNLVFPFVAK